MRIRRLRISTKLTLLCAIAVSAMLAIAAVMMASKKAAMLEAKQSIALNVVQMSHDVLKHYEALAQSGAMTREQAQQAALGVLRGLRYGDNDYVWVNDMQPKVVLHPIKPELEGKDVSSMRDPNGKALFVAFVETVKTRGAGFVDYLWPKPGLQAPVRKVSYVKGFEPWGWVVGTGLYVDDVEAAIRKDVSRMAAVVIGIGLCFVAICVLVTRSVVRPLNEAVAIAQRVASGDLTSAVETGHKDETGLLLKALKQMNDSLHGMAANVRSGTNLIVAASQEIAAGNADLSQRTEEQASSLEETASSMEELTGTVKQNAENARQANQLAAGASAVAVKGGQVVGRVVQTMSSINESSKKIADIIGVIDGIAFQTNILALNAAVEAARAGEQGRGFAVVAAEVRTLAQRSAAAAKEIKALITDSVGKVGDGTKLVDEAGKTMEEIVSAVKRVTNIMAEIAAASQEQTSGIEQVNRAIVQMDQVTQQNAALVEEAAAAADSMREQAQNLTESVAIFKLATGGAPHATAAKPQEARGGRRRLNRAKDVARLPTADLRLIERAVLQ